jgi:hypothetical protein
LSLQPEWIGGLLDGRPPRAGRLSPLQLGALISVRFLSRTRTGFAAVVLAMPFPRW